MQNKFETIGVFWKVREQTFLQCTRNLIVFLELLKELDPALFGRWFAKGKRKKEAFQNEIELSQDGVKHIFTKKFSEDSLSQVGFTSGIWTGHEEELEAATLGFTLGASSPYVKNHCVLQMPSSGDEISFYSNDENRKKLIELFQKAWQPDWIEINREKLETSGI